MELFRFLVKYSPGVLAVAVLLGIVSGVSSAAVMAIVNRALAGVAGDVGTLGLAFLGVTLTALTANLSTRLILLRLSTSAVREMRMSLCGQILVSPLRDVESHGPSKLLAVLTEDILAVSDTLAELPVVCMSAAVITACFTYLIWLSWPMALAFIGVFSLGVLIHEAIAMRTRPYLTKGREKWDELIAYYNALILGNKELKLHARRRTAFLREALGPTAEEMQTLSKSWHRIFAFAASFGQTFYLVVIGAILFVAPAFAPLEPSVLTGFVLMTIYMNGPISQIVGSIPTLHRAGVSLRKIESLGLSLTTREDSDVREEEVRPLEHLSGIEMQGLCYAYDTEGGDRGFALGPIDLRIEPGEILFVTGGNGSGKSSFARVLTGLYVPTGGTLRINGTDVDDLNRDAYRQNFSTVFSDYFLFTRLYGLANEQLAGQVEEYLGQLKLSGKVEFKDGRFSTVDLSQGQRKRLALLTAFVENRHVYLFDEWAADQDPAFKDVFYGRILPQLKARGKTVIVISHDSHYYECADRLIRFEDGVMVEDRRPRSGQRRPEALGPMRLPRDGRGRESPR